MSMSTHVVGFVAPDDRWKAMEAIYKSCTAAGIDPPKEVSEFFEWGVPDSLGMEVDVIQTTPYVTDSQEGFELDVSKLDPRITHIRFVNSW